MSNDRDLEIFFAEQDKVFAYTSDDERDVQRYQRRLDTALHEHQSSSIKYDYNLEVHGTRSEDKQLKKLGGSATHTHLKPSAKRERGDEGSSPPMRQGVTSHRDDMDVDMDPLPAKPQPGNNVKGIVAHSSYMQTGEGSKGKPRTIDAMSSSAKRKYADDPFSGASTSPKRPKPLNSLPVPDSPPKVFVSSNPESSIAAHQFAIPMTPDMTPAPLEMTASAHLHRIANPQPRLVRVSSPDKARPSPRTVSTNTITGTATKKKAASSSLSAKSSTPPFPPPASASASSSKSLKVAPTTKPLTAKQKREEKKARKKAKDELEAREAKMSPREYAETLGEKWAKYSVTAHPEHPHSCRGFVIFYASNELHDIACFTTRKRMDILVMRGATLQSVFDPDTVTHIVTDAPEKHVVQACGVRRLRDIPLSIPIVGWNWVISDHKHDFLYARFSSRMPEIQSAPRKAPSLQAVANHSGKPVPREDTKGGEMINTKGKGKGKGSVIRESSRRDSVEFSRISQFTEDENDSSEEEDEIQSRTLLLPPSSDHATSAAGRVTSDPLAEFYEQARADLEAGVSDDDSAAEESITAITIKRTKPSFACDDVGGSVRKRGCPNQDVVDKIMELKTLHASKASNEDRIKVYTYGRAIGGLRNYPKPIRSYEEALTIQGVGDKTALKIMEIIETGDLRRIKYERTEDIEVMKLFRGIYGVGPNRAQMWYNAGCRTLDDIRDQKFGISVDVAQQIGLRFYDDINTRMPREEARAIFDLIKPIALKIDPNLFIEIMGSYRRGKADCGDIDILITRDYSDGRTHAGVVRRLHRELHRVGILTEDLSVPHDMNDLETCYRGLCRLNSKSRRRRIDILSVPYDYCGAALLYYTGDDIFNRSMRLKANKMGYSLNQRGLYAGVIRNPSNRTEKLSTGSIIASKTEAEIFKVLGVPWQEPHQRVRG